MSKGCISRTGLTRSINSQKQPTKIDKFSKYTVWHEIKSKILFTETVTSYMLMPSLVP